MSRDTERGSPPLRIHFGNGMLEDAIRDATKVMRRAERGEFVEPERHLSFEGWEALTQALRVAGLDEQTAAVVIAALKGMAGEDECPFEAPDDSASPAPWDRSALANLRRKWLHYHALGERTIRGEDVAGDLAPIVPAFEAACDEVDRLRQRAERFSASADITDSHGQADVDADTIRLLDEATAQSRCGWARQLTDVDLSGIADALSRRFSERVSNEEFDVLLVAPAMTQGYSADEYLVAVRTRGSVLILSGAEIGWSIVPPEQLDETVAQLQEALHLHRHMKEFLP